jgi:protein-tyrosine phosphatase
MTSIDANKVVNGLYQGGQLPIPAAIGPDRTVNANGRITQGFDVVVLAAREIRPPRDLIRVPLVVLAELDDSGERMTRQEGHEAMGAASQVVRALSQGKRVLVTCAQGKNRSGLITCLALTLGRGMPPWMALATVRAARPGAMSNQDFERFLRAICQRVA